MTCKFWHKETALRVVKVLQAELPGSFPHTRHGAVILFSEKWGYKKCRGDSAVSVPLVIFWQGKDKKKFWTLQMFALFFLLCFWWSQRLIDLILRCIVARTSIGCCCFAELSNSITCCMMHEFWQLPESVRYGYRKSGCSSCSSKLVSHTRRANSLEGIRHIFVAARLHMGIKISPSKFNKFGAWHSSNPSFVYCYTSFDSCKYRKYFCNCQRKTQLFLRMGERVLICLIQVVCQIIDRDNAFYLDRQFIAFCDKLFFTILYLNFSLSSFVPNFTWGNDKIGKTEQYRNWQEPIPD